VIGGAGQLSRTKIAGGDTLSWQQAGQHGLFGLIPAICTVFLVGKVFSASYVALDFHHEYWVAGLGVLHGADPYMWSHTQIANQIAFPYPPVAALFFAPFALLSLGFGQALFTGLCLLAALSMLRVLGVNDWRVYGVALVWPPVVAAYHAANLTLLLLLGLALLWRLRDRSPARWRRWSRP
jgi:hypothetical protein